MDSENRKYRKKPVVIEAVQLTDNAPDIKDELARLRAIIDEAREFAQGEIDEPWDEHTDDLARRFRAILDRANEEA
jgi:hypothetical protein